ncbi:cache domain-containing protein [Clostridium sp. D2Q-11]|uniref:Cache domain-containing protein n=1 Tax=Anaeromonas frigoriresistens TaxID=2683708 RepID=A0A942UX38_9FIRM|nr:cache domain-containing protein [Anaeromonas frigoriresistens]MBS4538526.1 cache domain-containing protein [Anaeromonas frigoriresistens]
MGAFAYNNSAKSLEDEVGAKVENYAVMHMEKIDQLMYERIKDLESISISPSIIGAIESISSNTVQDQSSSENEDATTNNIEVEKYLNKVIKQSSYFSSLFITDKNGYIINLGTNDVSTNTFKDEEWWNEAFNEGISFKDLEYDETLEKYVMPINIAIKNEKGQSIGVI